MLDASLQMLKSKYNIVLADLSYENRTLADRLINDSRTIKFQGVSVSTVFTCETCPDLL